MPRIGALVVAALIVGGAVAVLTAPSDDAASPDWVKPLVDDGRASLLDNIDLIEPGSRLVFTGARCRSDGTIALFYENRWLWVVHRDYYAQTSPPYRGRGGFSGGVLDGPIQDDRELRDEVWLAEHRDVACAEARLR